MNDVGIITKEVVEVNFNNFKILYEDNTWFAESNDPENDDIIIIENDVIRMDKDIELFDNYILTVQKFNELKGIVKND